MNPHHRVLLSGGISLTSLIVLVLFVFNVNPTGKSVLYVLIPIVLVWVCLFFAFRMVGQVFLQGQKLYKTFVFVFTTTLVLLGLLSGLGQLTPRDIVLTVLLAIVAAFYVHRTWSKDQ